MDNRVHSIPPGLVLLASILVQLCLGGVYAWTTFVAPLQHQHGFTAAQTQLIFGVTIATFTVVMVIAGRLLPRVGPRRMTTLAAVLFALGYLLAANSAGQYLLILLGIGVIAGIGIGCGYVCPLTTALSWYPHRRGLVMGCVVAGFGAGAILLTTVTELAFARGVPVLHWFAWLAVGYGVLLLLCAQLLVLPAHTASSTVTAPPPLRFWGDPQFWALVFGIFCGTFAGLLVIGNLKAISLSWGMTASIATVAVSLFAAGNAAGRIGWGWLADRWGAKAMIPVMLMIGMVTLAAWPFATATGPLAFLLLVLLIAFFFGGCFILFATQVCHRYGADQLSLVYPWVFLAYGMAALTGPWIGGWLYDMSQEYRLATFIAAMVCGVGAGGFALLTRLQDAPLPMPARRDSSADAPAITPSHPVRSR